MMVGNTCPACGAPIALADINVAQGVGLCRACGKLSGLRAIAEQPAVDPAVLTRLPAGCDYAGPINGRPAVVRASMRSLGSAFGLLCVCLFWNGIVSIFVLFAIKGMYEHFVGPLPAWFPAPASKTEQPMTLGMALFLCLFLTPFVAIGLSMVGALFLGVLGSVEVTIDGVEGRVRTGVGPLRVSRRFDAGRVRRVTTGTGWVQSSNRPSETIRIEGEDRTINFASMLPDYRRAWMKDVLQQLLLAPAKRGRGAG